MHIYILASQHLFWCNQKPHLSQYRFIEVSLGVWVVDRELSVPRDSSRFLQRILIYRTLTFNTNWFCPKWLNALRLISGAWGPAIGDLFNVETLHIRVTPYITVTWYVGNCQFNVTIRVIKETKELESGKCDVLNSKICKCFETQEIISWCDPKYHISVKLLLKLILGSKVVDQHLTWVYLEIQQGNSSIIVMLVHRTLSIKQSGSCPANDFLALYICIALVGPELADLFARRSYRFNPQFKCTSPINHCLNRVVISAHLPRLWT